MESGSIIFLIFIILRRAAECSHACTKDDWKILDELLFDT